MTIRCFRRHTVVLVSRGATAGFLAFGCSRELGSETPLPSDTPAGASTTLAEYVVDTATVRIPLLLPAQLYVEHDAVVVSRTAGTVDSIFVELGDEVKAGQKLARLESAEQEIALASAEADFDNIELIADRARVLRKSGSITTADSQQAEFQLRQAAIALQKAKRDLELTSVTAPFHGVVSARAVRPRRYVAPGDTLFRVSEVEPLFARIRVPEASVNLVRTGETAVIIGSGGESTTATIIHAAPILDAGSGTREVVLKVARQRGSLRTGANVTVRVGSDRRRVVVVAREAIAPEGYALVLNDGRSTMRAVVLGSLLDKGRVEVVSGLSPGERLVRPKP